MGAGGAFGRAAVVEATLRRELGRAVEFSRMDPAGRLVRSPAADEHFPIVYTETMAGNERALRHGLAFGPGVSQLGNCRQPIDPLGVG